MASAQIPAYYQLLNVQPNATTDEIRTAYKKESLKTHPDRLPNATPSEKKAATAKFQAVADAYYVLSNPQRRREYDALLRSRGTSTSSSARGSFNPFSTDPETSASFFEQFSSFFAKPGPREKPQEGAEEEDAWDGGRRPDADDVFGNVFDDLLRPEIQRRVNWWTYLGAASGASIGYIIANIPGAVAGGLMGNRLGAIRDAKGKPVMVVFTQLGGSQKAEILKALALKVFGSLASI